MLISEQEISISYMYIILLKVYDLYNMAEGNVPANHKGTRFCAKLDARGHLEFILFHSAPHHCPREQKAGCATQNNYTQRSGGWHIRI
jgi:hypothetical protein